MRLEVGVGERAERDRVVPLALSRRRFRSGRGLGQAPSAPAPAPSPEAAARRRVDPGAALPEQLRGLLAQPAAAPGRAAEPVGVAARAGGGAVRLRGAGGLAGERRREALAAEQAVLRVALAAQGAPAEVGVALLPPRPRTPSRSRARPNANRRIRLLPRRFMVPVLPGETISASAGIASRSVRAARSGAVTGRRLPACFVTVSAVRRAGESCARLRRAPVRSSRAPAKRQSISADGDRMLGPRRPCLRSCS